MGKQTPKIEWQIVASEADWERLRQPPPLASKPATSHMLRLNRYFWSVAALCLLLASAGGWLWRTDQVRAQAAEPEAAAQQELGVVEQISVLSAVSLPGNPLAIDGWRQFAQDNNGLRAAIENNAPAANLEVALHAVEFWGDQAAAHIVTSVKNGAPVYRQTRFYQRTEAGWVRTDPDAALWGPERSLETSSFVFHFRQKDAPAVIAVAPQVEGLYTTLRRNFGLPITPGAEKLVIEVSVTQTPGVATPWFNASNHFSVPAPAVYWAPVELTDAELLAQSIALPLLAHVLVQASDQHQISAAWQPLLDALHLWQVWDLDLPLAAWREEVVQWLYVELPASRLGVVVLPERYMALCAAHTLWMQHPLQIDIPLWCNQLDRAEWYFSSVHWQEPPTRLDQLAQPALPSTYLGEERKTSRITNPAGVIALATLIEYAVATYGRERLPVLMAGLGHYESWDTLIPAVYGVSPAEFEAGWLAYLAARYSLP